MMPRPKPLVVPSYTTARGQARRAAIEQALREAGPAGLRMSELCHLIDCQGTTAEWALLRMPDIAYWPAARVARRRRIWHVCHRAEADAYIERANAAGQTSITHRSRAAQRLHRLLLDRQHQGTTVAEGAALMQCTPRALEHVIQTMARAGAIAWRCKVNPDEHPKVRRWYATSPDLPATLAPRRMPPRPPKPRLAPGARIGATDSRPMTAPARSVADGLHGLVLAPGAKVQLAKPTAQAPAAAAEALFAALGPGRYLEHDNAVARAYAARPAPGPAPKQARRRAATPPRGR